MACHSESPIRLLCTDLDRTLLPNGEAPESPGARKRLFSLLESNSVQLAYVSGRDEQRVRQAIDEWSLLQPDWVVADVGGTILQSRTSTNAPAAARASPRASPASGEWVRSAEWRAHLANDWQGRGATAVHAVLAGLAGQFGLRAQEADRQGEFKCSWYVDESVDAKALTDSVYGALTGAALAAQVIYSHDPEKRIGLLDVLPERASKAQAIAWLMGSLGLQPAQVLFAGDSGNDVDALLGAWHSVLVGNGDAQARHAIQAAGDTHGCHVAQGMSLPDGTILNGNYAAGIVEALLRLNVPG